jgi:hypothetical protein
MSTPPAAVVDTLRKMMKPGRRWVVFEHFTVVVVTDDTVQDPGAWAKVKLANEGKIVPGTAAGDFTVDPVEGVGWVVGSHDPDVFTFVPATELEPGVSDVTVGIAGRTARGADADAGNVILVGP